MQNLQAGGRNAPLGRVAVCRQNIASETSESPSILQGNLPAVAGAERLKKLKNRKNVGGLWLRFGCAETSVLAKDRFQQLAYLSECESLPGRIS